MIDLLDPALDYAAAGIPLFPCLPGGKAPAVAGGFKAATCGESTIRRWSREFPGCNWAMPTGKASGLVVVDVDPAGREAWEALIAKYGLSETLQRKTPRGIHYVFRMPAEEIRNSAGRIAAGIDIRGEGGYVLILGQTKNGTYEQVNDCPPAELPDWLKEMMIAPPAAADEAKPAPATVADYRRQVGMPAGDALREAAAAYARKAEAQSEGGRNAAAFRLAGGLAAMVTPAGEVLREQDIYDIICVEWNPRNTPPLGEKELCATVASALKNGTPRPVKIIRPAGRPLRPAAEGEVCPNGVPGKQTIADLLVNLAHSQYRFGISTDGEPFAVRKGGSNIALLFRGNRSALRARLAKEFRDSTGKTPNAAALSDALCVLEGESSNQPSEKLSLRVGEHNGSVVMDLGTQDGRAVMVDSDGRTIRTVAASPIVFRRTALTASLPVPEPAKPADLLRLRELLNAGDESWPLLAGWLIAAVISSIPHPVLMLGGEQGTGKSTAARLMLGLVDPSAALLRSEPKDVEQWAVAAAGSWCVCLDNISHITPWLSDAICKAVTGDGLVRGKLYTDSDISVLNFRRCIVITSIDHGSLRGDLGDRLVLADLEVIPETCRRTDAEIEAAYLALRPKLFGAVLSAVGLTLAAMPSIRLEGMPRMADFARVLAAIDAACPELTGGKALELFIDQRRRVADEVIDGDAVALAILKLVKSMNGWWRGTADELLDGIRPDRPPRGWPLSARGLSGRLRRTVPALRAAGLYVHFDRKNNKNRDRYIDLTTSSPNDKESGEQPSEPSETRKETEL